jgi:hypothetical protein
MTLLAVFLGGIGVGYLMASTAASLVEDRPAFRWAGFLIISAALFPLAFCR